MTDQVVIIEGLPAAVERQRQVAAFEDLGFPGRLLKSVRVDCDEFRAEIYLTTPEGAKTGGVVTVQVPVV